MQALKQSTCTLAMFSSDVGILMPGKPPGIERLLLFWGTVSRQPDRGAEEHPSNL